jgi:hypothetical protein
LNESVGSHKYVRIYEKDQDKIDQNHRYSLFSVPVRAENEENRKTENLSDQSASASTEEIPGYTEKTTEKVEYPPCSERSEPTGLIFLGESQRET